MKKTLSIGYIDSYGDFCKFKDKNGYTSKYATLDECKELMNKQTKKTIYKVMRGWEVIEIIDRR